MNGLRTPLFDWHVRHKARMVSFGGWEMPVQYQGIIEEHTAVRETAGLFDISHMGRLSFAGNDAGKLIDLVFTNSTSTMKDFQIRYGLICNEAGGILDDVLVYRWPFGWAMVVNASSRAKILAHLEIHKAGLDVDIRDQTLETAMIAVQGPKAISICSPMFDADLGALKYYYATSTRYKGKECIVSRTGYTGEDGIEIMLGAGLAEQVCEELLESKVTPCGLGARDTLRLEAGMPLYGHELTEEIDPFQSGLGWAVKLEKGDFIGSQQLRTLSVDSSRLRRVGLEIEGRRAAREGSAVLRDGAVIGRVSSGSFSPTLGKAIAMAYVEPSADVQFTPCEVDIRGTTLPARVVPIPFYKRPPKCG